MTNLETIKSIKSEIENIKVKLISVSLNLYAVQEEYEEEEKEIKSYSISMDELAKKIEETKRNKKALFKEKIKLIPTAILGVFVGSSVIPVIIFLLHMMTNGIVPFNINIIVLTAPISFITFTFINYFKENRIRRSDLKSTDLNNLENIYSQYLLKTIKINSLEKKKDSLISEQESLNLQMKELFSTLEERVANTYKQELNSLKDELEKLNTECELNNDSQKGHEKNIETIPNPKN